MAGIPLLVSIRMPTSNDVCRKENETQTRKQRQRINEQASDYQCDFKGCKQKAGNPSDLRPEGLFYYEGLCDDHRKSRQCGFKNCERPTDLVATYCDRHRCQHHHGCQQMVRLLNGVRPASFCDEHSCVCGDPTLPGLKVCTNKTHCCAETNCQEPAIRAKPQGQAVEGSIHQEHVRDGLCQRHQVCSA